MADPEHSDSKFHPSSPPEGLFDFDNPLIASLSDVITEQVLQTTIEHLEGVEARLNPDRMRWSEWHSKVLNKYGVQSVFVVERVVHAVDTARASGLTDDELREQALSMWAEHEGWQAVYEDKQAARTSAVSAELDRVLGPRNPHPEGLGRRILRSLTG